MTETNDQHKNRSSDFDHLDPASRLTIMENKYKVVEDQTITVSKLSTKVSLLLTIMSFAVVIVSAAAVYTFTGLNTFKDVYMEDRLEMHDLIHETQMDNRELLTQGIHELKMSVGVQIGKLGTNMDTKIKNIETNMDTRMNLIESQYTELKRKIKEQ